MAYFKTEQVPGAASTFVTLGTMESAGSTTIEFPSAAVGTSFGFRVELTPNGDVGPNLKRIAAKLHHPQLITVYDVIEDELAETP